MEYTITVEEFRGRERARKDGPRGVDPGGIWSELSDLIDTYGLPSGMEDWNEGGCVSGDHNCDGDPDGCLAHGKESVREWLDRALGRAEGEIDFHLGGQDWATLTITRKAR